MLRKPISKAVGERLRTIRKMKVLSQEELAHAAGLHPTYIGQLERGEKNPTIDTIDKVTSSLGISLSELFRLTENLKEDQSETILQLRSQINQLSEEDRKTIIKIIDVMVEWKEKTNNQAKERS
ncbi:helix-turn-helix domain-containing protein [Sediminibacillus albus]|uniref:DNA-binding transcriptional regulator, XRE-family HTH domain n=1 Tax=Sediminibacillus albus TaxID=407036 RepID=A0A1G9B8C5_9BACI|nr:helix-turn-helix transcriptional regulator [Sediminibacillus albus]SDK35733.1 DNA-binding transcriptional regulator, XRE-family HTH domain [Sediminibacillus albus]